ncbi:hypothetical protein MMC14_003533 [Varicellaria rhodocarpa]|nr:hypothetical protein [Varicellaria rhodocarpa]
MNPFPLWSTAPSTYRDLVTLYSKQADEAISKGEYSPYVWPYRSFGVYLVIFYFLLRPSTSITLRYARYPLFMFLVYTCVSAIRECKSGAVAMGYGIGLLHSWGMLWLASLMIFNDARRVFKRIEKREVVEASGALNESLQSSEEHNPGLNANGSRLQGLENNTDCVDDKKTKYAWQSLPSTFLTRCDWVYDLLCNFRGTGWSYQISSIPGPPSYILHDLDPSMTKDSPPISKTGNIRYPNIPSLLRTKGTTFILLYLALDTLKVVMMLDPYFWGLIDSAPPEYLPTFISTSSILTRTYRLQLSLAGTVTALNTIFNLAPVFLGGLLGTHFLGVRGEAWHYPDTYGSYKNILTNGIAGAWGGWWHQTFRFGFEAPTMWIAKRLGWEKKSLQTKTLSLVIAFGCSGCLHACGSYTTWPPTNPIAGPACFFWLQPLGIGAQMLFAGGLKRLGVRDRLPLWLRGLGNLIFVHVWFYHTAPYLTDDFARCGIWLFEPVPVSFLRGMGWGLAGEGWWCWHMPLVRWHSDDGKWWRSGLAI